MKKCLISFSSHGRENYNEAMLNMIISCRDKWDGDYLLYSFDGYCDRYFGVEINLCKSIKFPQPKEFVASAHSEVPYQFKPALFQIAIEKGYDQVVWVDSTIRMLKPIDELLAHAKQYGVCVFDNLGHPLKNWISDAAQHKQGVTNEALETMRQIMACVIIFDFTNPKGKAIFERWKAASLDGVSFQNNGSNRDGFKAHRHDQAILSVICEQEGIPMLPYGYLVYPPHHQTKEYGDNNYFLNKGIN